MTTGSPTPCRALAGGAHRRLVLSPDISSPFGSPVDPFVPKRTLQHTPPLSSKSQSSTSSTTLTHSSLVYSPTCADVAVQTSACGSEDGIEVHLSHHRGSCVRRSCSSAGAALLWIVRLMVLNGLAMPWLAMSGHELPEWAKVLRLEATPSVDTDEVRLPQEPHLSCSCSSAKSQDMEEVVAPVSRIVHGIAITEGSEAAHGADIYRSCYLHSDRKLDGISRCLPGVYKERHASLNSDITCNESSIVFNNPDAHLEKQSSRVPQTSKAQSISPSGESLSEIPRIRYLRIGTLIAMVTASKFIIV